MHCPRCGGQSVRRSTRVGVFERLISAAYVYPFRCQRCTHRFRAMNWGHRYPHPKGERRDYERVAIRLPARITAGTESFDAETTDLSVTGCAVRTDATFTPGTEVRLTVRLGAGGKPVEIAEAIVRATNAGRASLQFIHVAVAEQRRLAEFVHGIALPRGGRPRRRPRLRVEMVAVAVVGLVVVLLLLSLIARVGTPYR